jgi:site-specific recombinase XerD
MDYSINGSRIRKPLGLRDWQAAQRRARDIEADGNVNDVGTPITIKKALDDFEADAANTIKASTLKQYKRLFRRLRAYCEGKGLVFLRQLTVVEVRNFRNSWATYSPRTAGKHIEKLKRLFTWCLENGWIEAHPAKPLKIPRVDETDVVPFSEEEVDTILKACDAYRGKNRIRLIALTKLLLATGLRISDAVIISKSKFTHGEEGWMVELRTMKTGTPVACPIPADLAKSIMKLESETPFWTGKSDVEDAAKNWQKIHTRVFKAAAVKGTPHQFRHTFAKRLLVKGVPIGHVAALLGNTEEVCRSTYAKWIPERQAALNKAVMQTW